MEHEDIDETIRKIFEENDNSAIKLLLDEDGTVRAPERYDRIVRHAIATKKYNIVEELIAQKSYKVSDQTIEFAANRRLHSIVNKLVNCQFLCEKDNYFLMALNSGNVSCALNLKRTGDLQHDEVDSHSTDGVKTAKRELRIWQEQTHPMYLLIYKENPLNAAIACNEELYSVMKTDRTNKMEYEKLSEQCNEFAANLLDCCDDDGDITTIFAACDSDILWTITHDRFANVITNHNCQNWLYGKWLGSMATRWKTMSKFKRCLHVLKQAASFPYYSVRNAIKPRTAENTVIMNNFIHSATSYVFFLSLLLHSVFYEKIHGSHPVQSFIVTDYVVAAWIFTYFIQVLADFITIGKPAYIKFWWTWYQVAMVSFFLAAGISNFIANLSTPGSPQMLTWKMSAEGVYAFGITFAFIRILEWLHLSAKFGSVVVSLSQMTNIILRLLLIFAIVLFAFSFGMFKLYKDFHYTNAVNGTNASNTKFPFSSYRSTLKVLFWVIFNYGDPDHVEIPSSYYWNQDESDVTKNLKVNFTMVIGYGMWALFHIAFAILLLNMLIAILTSAIDNIQGNSDTKWKLARTKLWLYYLNAYHAVPPPFNILLYVSKFIQYATTQKCAESDIDKNEKESITNQDPEKVFEKLIARYERKMCNPDTFETRDYCDGESYVEMRRRVQNEIKKTKQNKY